RAEEGTRTLTSLRSLPPQSSVSTYSTTSARGARTVDSTHRFAGPPAGLNSLEVPGTQGGDLESATRQEPSGEGDDQGRHTRGSDEHRDHDGREGPASTGSIE